MMKIKKSTIVAIVLTLSVSFTLVGCGSVEETSSSDPERTPSQLLESSLNMACKGEVPDWEELSNEDADSIKEQYKNTIDSTVSDFGSQLGISDVSAYEDNLRMYVKAAFNSAKYEVSEKYEETDEGYVVSVTVYPETFLVGINDYIDGEFTDKWKGKASEYASEDEFNTDMMNDLIEYLTEAAKNTEYGEGVVLNMHIVSEDSGFSIDENDMQQFWDTIIPAEY